jgi:ubiquinone/menaquinone biosynthesis C-methylase UbiE
MSVPDSTKDATLAGHRQSYNQAAADYDQARYDSAEGRFFNELEIEVLRTWLQPGPGRRVLDLPAGTGRLTVPLSVSGAMVVGADISENMLRVAHGKKQKDRAAHAHFAQVDGLGLPFADDTFDAIISFKFFHLVPNALKRNFIREMARVTKPGGKLVIEFNSPFYGGVLAFYRYYFRKQNPGGMRQKCLFPDQISGLFEGLSVRRRFGVKLPFAGTLSRVFGRERMGVVNRLVGSAPAARYFAYAILIEAEKTTPRVS